MVGHLKSPTRLLSAPRAYIYSLHSPGKEESEAHGGRREIEKKSGRHFAGHRNRVPVWFVGVLCPIERGCRMAERQLVIAVEGTAALGRYWPAIVTDYLEKIVWYGPRRAAPAPGHSLVVLSCSSLEIRAPKQIQLLNYVFSHDS